MIPEPIFDIFHSEIGEAIGIDIQAGEKINFGGIHAKAGAVGYFHSLTLVIGGHDFQTRAAFSNDIAPFGHGVLGQRGFFDFFRVTFAFSKEVIELKPL